MLHRSLEFNIAEVLLSHGTLKWCVAGGYARDLFFGRVPRDVDIAVFGFKSDEESTDAACVMIGKLQSVGLYDSHTFSGHEYTTDRVVAVIKVKGDIDIIFWDCSHKTPRDVMESFDYNINQFILDENSHPLFYGQHFGYLTPTGNSEVTEERKHRLLSVAHSVGWVAHPKGPDLPF